MPFIHSFVFLLNSSPCTSVTLLQIWNFTYLFICLFSTVGKLFRYEIYNWEKNSFIILVISFIRINALNIIHAVHVHEFCSYFTSFRVYLINANYICKLTWSHISGAKKNPKLVLKVWFLDLKAFIIVLGCSLIVNRTLTWCPALFFEIDYIWLYSYLISDFCLKSDSSLWIWVVWRKKKLLILFNSRTKSNLMSLRHSRRRRFFQYKSFQAC